MVTVSASDVVDFEFPCSENNDCKEPGDFFCGLGGSVEKVQCVSGTTCKIWCEDIKPIDVDEKWQYASISISPVEKMVGQPVVLTVVDSRDGRGIVYAVEFYKGGGFENEYVEGSTNVGSSLLVADTFTLSDYLNGELIASAATDRSGMASFSVETPGQYALRTANNYYVFIVADSSGNAFECGDGSCDSSLGEDIDACPQDCSGAAPEPEPVAPVDTPEPTTAPETPSEPSPTVPTVPADTEKPGAGDDAGTDDVAKDGGDAAVGGGIDMTLVIIIVVVIALIGIVAFLVKSGKIKMGGPKKPAAPAAQPPAQAAAPAAPAPAPQPAAQAGKVCPKCGTPVEAGNSFCMNCGTKI